MDEATLYKHWGQASPWLGGINPLDQEMPIDGDDGFFPTSGNDLASKKNYTSVISTGKDLNATKNKFTAETKDNFAKVHDKGGRKALTDLTNSRKPLAKQGCKKGLDKKLSAAAATNIPMGGVLEGRRPRDRGYGVGRVGPRGTTHRELRVGSPQGGGVLGERHLEDGVLGEWHLEGEGGGCGVLGSRLPWGWGIGCGVLRARCPGDGGRGCGAGDLGVRNLETGGGGGGLGRSTFELVVEGPLPVSIPEDAQGRGLQAWRPPIPEALKAS
ncbi:hypothetical protein MTR67_038576 [Solanum verrucosum]|uniref:Uncharacterized protein n=1 Tax=Solanum verrucosum TaxID=315347 RepID=A0AAF0UGR5_SOLVR|nr:hypothetical protein MTR67_038576 [Solanum verrucosum]